MKTIGESKTPMFQVKDLIATLQNIDPEKVVIISSDMEGNQKAPLFLVSAEDDGFGYSPSNRDYALLKPTEDSDPLDVADDAIPAITLYPAM